MEGASKNGASDVGTVIVLAGVSCVGKTTLLNRIGAGDHSMIPALPDSFDLEGCDYRNAMDLASPEGHVAPGGTLFVHYDLFRPITFHGAFDFDLDPVLSILRRASDVAVLTLWETPETLRQRSVPRRRRLWRKLLQRPLPGRFGANYREFRGATRRRQAMQPWFDDPERLWHVHAAWFEWCRAAGVERHWIGRTSEGTLFTPLRPDEMRTPLWWAIIGFTGRAGPRRGLAPTAPCGSPSSSTRRTADRRPAGPSPSGASGWTFGG